MASTTVNPFPLATETGTTDNSAGSVNSGDTVDNAAGASGGSSSGAQISPNAMIAIIVVVSIVAVLGIAMSVLFYLTKKKEWKLREKMRRSAKKVVAALTPRRSEFPKSVKEGNGKSSRGRMRLDDVPPTPRLRPEDIEKGLAVDIRRSPDGRDKKSTSKKWPGRR